MRLVKIKILAIGILLLCSTPLLGTPFFGAFESAEITPLGEWDLRFGGGIIYLPKDDDDVVATHVTPQLSLRYGISPTLNIGGRLGLAVGLDGGPVTLLGVMVDLKVGTLRVPILGSFAGGAGLGLIDNGEGLSPVVDLAFYRSEPVRWIDSLYSYSAVRIEWFIVTGQTRGQGASGVYARITETFRIFMGVSFVIGPGVFSGSLGLMASWRF